MDSLPASPSPDRQTSALSGADHEILFTLTNTPEEFAHLVPLIEAFLEKNAVGFKDQYVIQLCLEESIINIIHHGYPTQAPDVIKVDIAVTPELIKVMLLDHGVSFNPLDQPESDTELSMEERSIGGLGIHLMKHYLQDMTYRRIGNANQLNFTRKRESEPVSG